MKRSFDTIMEIAQQPGGLHPALLEQLNTAINPADKILTTVESFKKRRTNPRTYKDTDNITMWLA